MQHEDQMFVGTKEDPKLQEFFSRKEDGDQVKFSGVGTINENNDGVMVLSLDEINFQEPKGKGKKAPKDDGADEPEPAAVQMMKGMSDSPEEEAAEGE